MHRARILRLTIIGLALFPASVVVAQTSPLAPARTTDPPFAAINASLLNAVDSAIETASVTPFAEDPLAQPPKLQRLTVPVASPHNIAERIDPLRPIVQTILAREGLPNEIAAIIRVESGGNPMALSPKGARGLWQLMPGTARRYGLRVDDHFDERLDIEKATTAAARYLKDLYFQFGSWPLALAAYNVGEVNLQRAIDRTGSRDFSILSGNRHLPLETQNYVPAVTAAMAMPFPTSLTSTQKVRSARFVFATSDESGE